jgi:hypothetical protein
MKGKPKQVDKTFMCCKFQDTIPDFQEGSFGESLEGLGDRS